MVFTASPLIQLKNVSFCYTTAQTAVLEQLDFSLHAGERLGLKGANGSGKSTLLRLLVGLLPPTQGEIKLFGQVCLHEKDFLPFRGPIGLLFQDVDDQLFCPTVAEDIAFGPLNQGKSVAEAQTIVEHTLRLLKLEQYTHRVTYRLSTGEKRLIALATVLAMQPNVLLLDEPTSGLDASTQQRVVETLLQLPQAMLIVSHDVDFLEKVAHRCLVLKAGRLY